MKKLLLLLILFLATYNLQLTTVYAIYDPRTVPNNQFGIHVVDPTDIKDVADLLNSSGGAWGYVKFVIPETDRNTDKWDSIFRELGRKKLIPIVRIATRSKDSAWAIPTEDSSKDWPHFLNSLTWPTENRYVVLFNEPNHASEWGNNLDPVEYGRMTVWLANQLKQASPDYFILPAGLDDSAPNSGDTMDAEMFLQRVVATNPDFLNVIDGWTSHSYPNPAFSGSPTVNGRGTIRSYLWELDELASLGEKRDLPVLIGETGWIHSEGERSDTSLLSADQVGAYITTAGKTVWNDPKIFAVTPFIYNYQTPPFDHFSWKKLNSNDHYPQYATYQALPKTAGKPQQRESYEVVNNPLPERLVAGSRYQFPIEIKNTGQAIISSNDEYFLFFDDASQQFRFRVDGIPELEPGATARVLMEVQTPEKTGKYQVTLRLRQLTKTFDLVSGSVNVIPPPSLRVVAQLGWRKQSNANGVSVLIYDGSELIYEFRDLTVENGLIQTPGILGIVPGKSYRIVTLVPYYLPRQSIQPISARITTIVNKRLLPLDANNDRHLSVDDLWTLLKTPPSTILARFF